MAVTIKQIAEACGVSRGTVDRVLNNRGKVKPEMENIIRRMAEQLGYRPNTAGKALAARKKNYVIGIILISEENEFFQDVLEGIHTAEEEIADYGIRLLIKTMKGYQVEKQLALMEEMQSQVQFLILNGINDKRIGNKVQELMAANIFVLTINTDVEESKRLCYVGCDFIRSGETAGGVLGLLTNGNSKVAVATGSVKVLGHNQRIQGFNQLCKLRYPNLEIVDIMETNDDDACAYAEMKKMLIEHPELTSVYIVAAGAAGVCLAIQEAGMADSITVVSSDNTTSVRKWMRKGLIKAVICQQPWMQGYRSVLVATEFLVKDIMPEKAYIMQNEIRILENIE